LTVEEYVFGLNPHTERYDFTLVDSSKIFLTVTLWIKPSSNNITVDMKDIVVAGDSSESASPVGFRTSGQYFKYVFSSGDARIEFGASEKTLTMYDCSFEFKTPNTYGISFGDYRLGTVTIGEFYMNVGDDPSITFAFVVSRATVNSGNLWLEVPNSPRIKLEVQKVAAAPTTTHTPTATPATTTPTSTSTTTAPAPLPTTFNPTSIPTSTAPGFSKEHPLPMGESLITPDGYEITVLEAIKGEQAWEMVKNAAVYNPSPDPGMEYIIITIKVKNISDDIGWSPNVNFRLIDSANILHNSWDKVVILPDGGWWYEPWENLNIGDEATGRLCFQMPVGESNPVLLWGLIELWMRFFDVEANDS